MAPRIQALACAIFLLCFCNLVSADEPTFPTLKEVEVESYSTEVQVTDVNKQASAYAISLYDETEDAGKLIIYIDGQIKEAYYDNTTYEILEVEGTSCVTWDADDSIYGLEGYFYGWLNIDPLVIGPTAPLYYAFSRLKDVEFEGYMDVREIPCEKYSLNTVEKDSADRIVENVTIYYYFAPKTWATPYRAEGLRVPMRIHIIGESSKNVADQQMVPIEIINDFAFFKPSIDSDADIQPPVGIGCPLRKESGSFPDIPDSFQYSAELVDVLYESKKGEVDAKFERVWYDQDRKIGRFDIYKRLTSSATFQDYNTGVMFEYTKEQQCQVKPLRNAFFEKYDGSGMLGEFKTAEEVLNLNGNFYAMGKREVRGLTCDVFESTETDYSYKDVKYRKFVVTAYFVEDTTTVGVNSEMESRIPVLIQLTGWNEYQKMVLKTQYNIFAFDDFIWPEMYADFEIEKCYRKTNSKTYFVLILKAQPQDAAYMENQDEIVTKKLRTAVARHANVPEWRIPLLKIDYKPTGVFATGLMVERPAELAQFYKFDSDVTKTKDKHFKMPEAKTLEDCATACIDGEDCKGFYFCNQVCFLKSEDPTATHDDSDESTNLGYCDEYIRAVKFTSNIHNTPLKKALGNLEEAVLNNSVPISFDIPFAKEVIRVADIVIGDGPYTGVDAGDKPYEVNIHYRALDPSLTTSKIFRDVELLNECYRKCQSMSSGCASFSYCGRAKKDSQKPRCVVSSEMVIRGRTSDLDLVEDNDCDIYDLRYLEYFTKFPEHVTFIPGYKDVLGVNTLEECARQCRLEDKGKCRGFEYCKEMKTCSLHTKHILDIKQNDKGSVKDKNPCVHYAAKFIADYRNLGANLVDDTSNVRYQLSLEDCARVCSEELGSSCKSFNYCPTGQGSCELSGKVLVDDTVDVTTKNECIHYEKRPDIDDWSKTKPKLLSKSGYTSKSFTGLVIGMLALGLIIGALGFVGYSYCRSRKTGEGMSVRFMKQDT